MLHCTVLHCTALRCTVLPLELYCPYLAVGLEAGLGDTQLEALLLGHLLSLVLGHTHKGDLGVCEAGCRDGQVVQDVGPAQHVLHCTDALRYGTVQYRQSSTDAAVQAGQYRRVSINRGTENRQYMLGTLRDSSTAYPPTPMWCTCTEVQAERYKQRDTDEALTVRCLVVQWHSSSSSCSCKLQCCLRHGHHVQMRPVECKVL